MLIFAAVSAVFLGIVHSYLGERYILIRLFKRDNLPKLFGNDWFTKRVLRFAWHLTTVAWLGFAAILYIISEANGDIRKQILILISGVFAVSGLLSGTFTKGKHISWIVFLAIALISFYVAMNS